MSHFKKYQLPILLLRYNSQLAFNLVKKFKNVITLDFVKRRVSKVSNMVTKCFNIQHICPTPSVPGALLSNVQYTQPFTKDSSALSSTQNEIQTIAQRQKAWSFHLLA